MATATNHQQLPVTTIADDDDVEEMSCDSEGGGSSAAIPASTLKIPAAGAGIPTMKGVPRSKRKLQKHLRSSGQAYISRTGKLIPAKQVAEELCQCPQKCEERVSIALRERLFEHFYGLGDSDAQNAFLRQHMDVRARLTMPQLTPISPSINNNNNSSLVNFNGIPTLSASAGVGTGKAPRRITCKYLVPMLPSHTEKIDVCQKAFVSAFVITTKRVRLQREKLISSMGLNSYGNARNPKPASPTENFYTQVNNIILSNHNNINNSMFMMQQSSASSMKLAEALQMKLPPHVEIERCDNGINTNVNGMKRIADGNGFVQMKQPAAKRCRRQLIDDPLLPFGLLVPDGVTIAPVFGIGAVDYGRDIDIVNNFFSNQLWKPEYILGTTYS